MNRVATDRPHATQTATMMDADRNHVLHVRIDILDIWKGLAIIGVIIFHFAWDLEAFGLAPRGMTFRPEWVFFARSLAGSFMLLVGISLFLSHCNAIRWRSFARRLVLILTAALAISVLTYFVTPEAFIYFGILHSIAVSSLLGLIFLRLPPSITALFGIVFLVGRSILSSSSFNTPLWYWTGLSTAYPPSSDYVPIFPWFGLVLLGMAFAKALAQRGLLERLGRLQFDRPSIGFVRGTGRHTLAIYLLHQPILFGGLYLVFNVL